MVVLVMLVMMVVVATVLAIATRWWHSWWDSEGGTAVMTVTMVPLTTDTIGLVISTSLCLEYCFARLN